MKKILYLTFIAALLTTACVAAGPGHPGRERILVPPLPGLIVLEIEPYYYFRGYHYHYINNHWFYSLSRGGPWRDLPFDHYPTEIRFKDRDNDRPHYWNREHSRYEDRERNKEREPRQEQDRQQKDRGPEKDRDQDRDSRHDDRQWKDRDTDHEQKGEHGRRGRHDRD